MEENTEREEALGAVSSEETEVAIQSAEQGTEAAIQPAEQAETAERGPKTPSAKKKFKKPTKRQVKSFLLYCLTVVAGNAIASAGASFFIVPNGFVMGGTTGVGIFVRNLLTQHNVTGAITEWAVNITVYTANIALFILGVCLLGKKFAAATAAGTVLYPAFMSLFNLANEAFYKANGHYIGMSTGTFGEANIVLGSPLLAMICGALLFGLGIAMVVRVGASTGGTDIPPLIFKKFFDWPISVTMWILDFAIVAINLIAAPIDAVLYGVLITLISSLVIDKISPIGTRRTQVKIISNHYKEIRDMILKKISRGVTLLYGQTGYLKEPVHMILTVISPRELVRLKNEVHRIDPEAFLTVSIVSEVRGRGFSADLEDDAAPPLKEVSDEDAPTETR